jgi:ribonuclease HI
VITVSTDGSCLRNPGGAIGWAWANHDGTHDSGGPASGTNQIAELMAVLAAGRAHPGDEPLTIQADSQYAIKCSSEWIHGWRRKGWRTASGGPVQNLELIRSIDTAIGSRPGGVTFVWVRGHRGDEFNERADELAGIAARGVRDGAPANAAPVVVTPAATVVPTPTPVTAPAAPVLEPDVLF